VIDSSSPIVAPPIALPRDSSVTEQDLENIRKGLDRPFLVQYADFRGYDMTRYTLQCFGGAGGQPACVVADALGMTRVFVHPLAGVLSAMAWGWPIRL